MSSTQLASVYELNFAEIALIILLSSCRINRSWQSSYFIICLIIVLARTINSYITSSISRDHDCYYSKIIIIIIFIAHYVSSVLMLHRRYEHATWTCLPWYAIFSMFSKHSVLTYSHTIMFLNNYNWQQ